MIVNTGQVAPDHSMALLIRESGEALADIDVVGLEPLLDRIGGSRVVLIGEATHGTSEFYRMRARITRELIRRKGFQFVAVEADWPDAARIDGVVRDRADPRGPDEPFSRFPTWMWRNAEVAEFVEWLRLENRSRPSGRQVGFYGLDLYSMFTSVDAVIRYLESTDPTLAPIARERYGCLAPWRPDASAYGRYASRFRACESAVVENLRDLLARRLEYMRRDGDRYFDALRNAAVVANAERYYRAMYRASFESWNLRDMHMFDTLDSLVQYWGPDAKGVVWEHNSHVGDARATEMGRSGELNVGQLARQLWGDRCYLIGFGTDHGQVAAASDWGGPVELKTVRPALALSYEAVMHRSAIPAFLLPLSHPRRTEVREVLEPERLERAIGVIYRPESELQSHYFDASLPNQFDEYIWFDETSPVGLLSGTPARGED